MPKINGGSTTSPLSGDSVDGNEGHRVVLVASDNPLIAPRAVQLLSAAGFEVTVALDAQAGWSCAAEVEPMLAIVDILIPGGHVRDSAALTLDLLKQRVPVLLLCSISSVPIDPRLERLSRNFEDHEHLPVIHRPLALISA